VIVGKCDDHNRTDLNVAIDRYRLLLDGVEAEDSGLREVDDGCSKEGANIDC
jgi:hypothetical protein